MVGVKINNIYVLYLCRKIIKVDLRLKKNNNKQDRLISLFVKKNLTSCLRFSFICEYKKKKLNIWPRMPINI